MMFAKIKYKDNYYSFFVYVRNKYMNWVISVFILYKTNCFIKEGYIDYQSQQKLIAELYLDMRTIQRLNFDWDMDTKEDSHFNSRTFLDNFDYYLKVKNKLLFIKGIQEQNITLCIWTWKRIGQIVHHGIH